MAFRPHPDDTSLRGAWRYWRPCDDGIVELGTVHGHDVALPTHFHDEDQVTFVLRGQRHFVVAGQVVSLSAGEGLHIPAGRPHRSLSGSSDVIAINLYLPPGAYAASAVVTAISDYWRRQENMDWTDLALLVAACRGTLPLAPQPAAEGREQAGQWETVSQAARLVGMSREGFSRRFSRLHGMPPHTFQLTEKLNAARRLLRAGEPIAAVAAEAGFADQSHLGRCFRRVFGVTPGQYRADKPVTSVL